jgi:tetratricopeptide (TPR) repeat protein
VALCLNNLGSLYLVMNDHEAAEPHLHEALAICERDGLVSTRGYVLANLTEVAMRCGDLGSAEALAERALEVAGATGNRAVTVWMKTKRANIAARRADLGLARATLADAMGLALSLGQPLLKFEALECFAELLEAQGEAACARRVLAFAAGHPDAYAAFRDQVRPRLDRLSSAGTADPPWPGMAIDELAHRIVAESGIAHAPLIAALRTAG